MGVRPIPTLPEESIRILSVAPSDLNIILLFAAEFPWSADKTILPLFSNCNKENAEVSVEVYLVVTVPLAPTLNVFDGEIPIPTFSLLSIVIAVASALELIPSTPPLPDIPPLNDTVNPSETVNSGLNQKDFYDNRNRVPGGGYYTKY